VHTISQHIISRHTHKDTQTQPKTQTQTQTQTQDSQRERERERERDRERERYWEHHAHFHAPREMICVSKEAVETTCAEHVHCEIKHKSKISPAAVTFSSLINVIVRADLPKLEPYAACVSECVCVCVCVCAI